MEYIIEKNFGFTLIELLVVLALIAVFTVIVAPFGADFYREQILQEQTQSLSSNLKLVQSRAMAGKNDSAWGVKFYPENQGCTDCYVLFQGGSYDGRDEDEDRVFNLSPGMTTEGMKEIVFEKGTGSVMRIVKE